MLRSICTVFVLLAACQAAFASVAKEHRIVELELTNEPSPKIELFDGEKSAALLGDMSAGQHLAGETLYTLEKWNENQSNEVEAKLFAIQVPKEQKIHYVKAVTTSGATAVICQTKMLLGQFVGFLDVRQPPRSKSLITVTVGVH